MASFKIIQYQENLIRRSASLATEEALHEALDKIVEENSTYFDLFSPTGDTLSVGITGKFGFIMVTRKSGQPPYLCASTHVGIPSENIEFDIGGTSTPFEPKQCLPIKMVLHAVVHYFQYQELLPDLEWEET